MLFIPDSRTSGSHDFASGISGVTLLRLRTPRTIFGEGPTVLPYMAFWQCPQAMSEAGRYRSCCTLSIRGCLLPSRKSISHVFAKRKRPTHLNIVPHSSAGPSEEKAALSHSSFSSSSGLHSFMILSPGGRGIQRDGATNGGPLTSPEERLSTSMLRAQQRYMDSSFAFVAG